MIRVDNDLRSKVDTIDSSNSVNQYLNIKLQEENNAEKKTTTTTKKTNNDIYQTIRTKASIVNSDQRGIQDRISEIQSQEHKIETIESTLKQAKAEYAQAIKNGQKENVKQKIKVRQLTKQITDLKNQTKDKVQHQEEIKSYSEEYIQDEENIVDKINEILKKINSTKSKLLQYKSELIKLSLDIESNRRKIVAQENEIKMHLDDSEYIINGVSINKYDYTDLVGNISTGIVIDIYI